MEKDFAARLKGLKTKHGLSNKQLQKQVGISNQALSSWENRKTKPSMDAVIKLAQFFGVTTDYLLGLTDY